MADQSRTGSEVHPLVRRLIEKKESRELRFVSHYRMPRPGQTEYEPDRVIDFLGLDAADLSAAATETLEALDHTAAPGWIRFRWQLSAFTYLQDIFDAPFYVSVDKNPLLLFEQFYFYFESLRLLRESLLCGLNGFAVATNALLRPFLEFSVLQNYYYRTIEASGSFAELERYLKNGLGPNARTALKKALPPHAFCKPIRFRISQHLGGLSQSTLHPYHPVLSQAHHRSDVHVHSLDSFHFWQTLSMVLEAALWMYYVNFPMLFSPVDVLRRFGFNGPVGVFIDEFGSLAVRNSLSRQDRNVFSAYAEAQQKTVDHIAFYNSHTDLSDDEIISGWRADDNGPFPGLLNGYVQTVAKLRATRAALAHSPRMRIEERMKNAPQDLDTLDGWIQLAKRGAGN